MRTRTHAGVAVPALLGAVALLVGGCGTQRAGTGTSEGPPPLAIGVGAAVAADAAAGGGDPVLRAALPDGPSNAPVRRFTGEVDEGLVAGLARALGLTAPVAAHPYGWSVGQQHGPRLTVRSDGTGAWAYADGSDRCSTVVDVDGPDGPDVATSCVTVDDTRRSAPPTSVARAVAAPVLAAVGLDGDEPSASAVGDATWVSVDPRVAGLRTLGLETSVVVDADGIRSASGQLRDTSAGADYPLIDAAAAWKQLGDLPVPDIAMVCPAPGAESAPPCRSTPTVVTHVELGLALRSDGTQWLLVPTWLFDTAAGGTTAIVAVAPRYLAPAPTADGRPDGGSGSSGGSTGSGGGTDAVPPAPPDTGTG